MRTRRPPLVWILPLLVLLPWVGGAPAEAREARALAGALKQRLARAGLAEGKHGVVVLERGPMPRPVTVVGNTASLIPASVAKILTACAALDLLGPAFVFRTRVSVRGEVGSDGVLDGDLVVHGDGDPNLGGGGGRGAPRAALLALARQVHAAGIRRVAGALVLDDLIFDQAFTHADWTDEDRGRPYGAGVAGFSWHESVIRVDASGASNAGARATLHFPLGRARFRIDNRTKTTAGRDGWIGGTWPDAATLRVTGRLGTGRRAGGTLPVKDPGRFALGAFAEALEEVGVEIEGLRRAADAADATPGRVVAVHETPLLPALAEMNQDSDNYVASTLFKRCGVVIAGIGTWRSGEEAVRRMLLARNISPAGTRIVDGSGLAPTNRITAGLLAQVLVAFDHDPLRGPLLYDSLATGGRTGTLRKRLNDRGVVGRVHAKSGTLNDVRVRSLAGYLDGQHGHPGYTFAVVLNGGGASRTLIDDLVRELARP